MASLPLQEGKLVSPSLSLLCVNIERRRLSASQEEGPHQKLTSLAPSSFDFQPPEPWEHKLLLFKLPSRWSFVMADWDKDTDVELIIWGIRMTICWSPVGLVLQLILFKMALEVTFFLWLLKEAYVTPQQNTITYLLFCKVNLKVCGSSIFLSGEAWSKENHILSYCDQCSLAGHHSEH